MRYLDIIDMARANHDLDKKLGLLTKVNLISGFAEEYDNPALKTELQKCDNFNQMINTIEQKTGELSKERDKEELHTFQDRVDQIIKFARL